MATVLGIAYHEAQVVGGVTGGPDNLGDRAFSSGHKLDGELAGRDGVMCGVDKPDGLKGFDDPAREGRCAVFLLGGEEDAGRGILEHMRALFKATILD